MTTSSFLLPTAAAATTTTTTANNSSTTSTADAGQQEPPPRRPPVFTLKSYASTSSYSALNNNSPAAVQSHEIHPDKRPQNHLQNNNSNAYFVRSPTGGGSFSRLSLAIRRSLRLSPRRTAFTFTSQTGTIFQEPADDTSGGEKMSAFADLRAQPTEQDLPGLAQLRELRRLNRNEKVKKLVRVSQWPIRDEVRLGLWRLLTRSKDSDTQAAFYRAQLEEHLKRTEAGLSRAKFVSDPAAVLNNQRLSEPGVVALTRLLHFVEVQRPEIESAPMLYPLGALFLHYMSEEDAYASLICLLSGKLVTTSDCEWAALPHVVLALVRRHKPHAYQALRRRAGTPATVAGDRELSATMRQFLVWIFGSLPLDYVIRVVDCYLVEGLKFLLRAAIALVYIWYKQHKTQSVPSDYADKEPRERMRLLRAELRESASRIGVSVETFIDVCVHIRNLQSTNILRLRHDWEIEVRPDVIRAREERASRRGAHAGWRSAQSSAAAAHVVPFVSKIVGADAAVELILALPQRFQLETPQLLFRLSEQGASFTRLWACVDEAEQTLLLIRSTSGARFGAFCSSSWAERNDRHNRTKTRYFGTGESWVWRLDEQLALPVIHQWVGLERSTDEDAPQMFMTANDKLLIVGSGGHDAIRIADELTTGLSGASTTFGTDGPLCASQENSLNKPKNGPTTTAGTPTNASGAFEIAELEVFEPTTSAFVFDQHLSRRRLTSSSSGYDSGQTTPLTGVFLPDIGKEGMAA